MRRVSIKIHGVVGNASATATATDRKIAAPITTDSAKDKMVKFFFWDFFSLE